MVDPIPVITIDGPSGSGKGTVSRQLATQWGWHFLDSGAIYRLVALKAMENEIDAQAERELIQLAGQLSIRFEPDELDVKVFVGDDDVTAAIRTEKCAMFASIISGYPALRKQLLLLQRHFKQSPGLVADGRDMGTVVFPEATLKIFLTATAEERAERRYKQLKMKGISVNLSDLLLDLQKRDLRDASRIASPLTPAEDAICIDTTIMTISDVVQAIAKQALAKGIIN